MAAIAGDNLTDMVLCLSACEAGNKAVAQEFKEAGRPPAYIVGPESKPGYAQACVAWSVFYHVLAQEEIDRDNMKAALDRMNAAVDSDFLYRRWTGQKYRRYPAIGQASS